jgi:two-component system response regulator VanR
MTNTTVIVCDHDVDELYRIQQGLMSDEFEVQIISDALELVSVAQANYPAIVIVNPDMKGFNQYDVCKKLMKDKNIPVLLLTDSHSTHRVQIDQCRADDELTKPVEINNLLNLIQKHIAVPH